MTVDEAELYRVHIAERAQGDCEDLSVVRNRLARPRCTPSRRPARTVRPPRSCTTSPGAKAPSHLHPGFELIYALSGELETDDGVYAAGSLLVMPPNSVHAPRSPMGCVGLVVWERPVQVV